MKKLKVGIIGCGYIASKWHIPGFQRLKQTEVAAVCDISPALAESTAKKFNIPKTYSNFAEMLQKENLDVVDICTPPGTHAPLTIQAIEADCHVLLEKPMALKLSDCDEMVNASKKQNKKLCIIHNELFRPPLMKAKKLVQDGAIGKVIGMQWTRFTNREEYIAKENHWIHKLPGGPLGETGPHGVYTSLAFLNSVNNVDITAKNNMKYPWAKFDYFDITLDGEEAVSSLIICHASNNYVAEVSIFGSEGMLKLDLQAMVLTRYKLEKAKPAALAMSTLGPAGQMARSVFSNSVKMSISKNSALMNATGHGTEIEEFVRSVVNNTKSPVTAEEGREVIRVMEALVKRLNEKYGAQALNKT